VGRIFLLAASLWALYHALAGFDATDLLAHVEDYGPQRLALGVSGTTLSFVLLGSIELVALRSVGVRRAQVSTRVALGTGFVASALSQSIGVALLTGTAVRMRAYLRRGLDAAQVTQVSAAVTLIIALGLLSAAAWAFCAEATPVALYPHLVRSRPFGAVLGVIVLAYVIWCLRGARPASTRKWWRIPQPPPRIVVVQLFLSCADWLVTGAVLFAFVSADLPLGIWPFLRIYVIAQIAGMISHVPAGIGVFEVVLLTLLARNAPDADRTALVAAIVMFRAIYYLLPLIIAMATAAVSELRHAGNTARDIHGDRERSPGLVAVD
jgi:uncharacterized membrane protein YbhN (UPF0104 family)